MLIEVVAFSDTTLEPFGDVYVCPGMKTTLTCNETSVSFLTWTWTNATLSEMQSYDAALFTLQRLNITEVFRQVEGVTTTLIDINLNFNGSLYITSILQFTPSDNFVSANISCNIERRELKITGMHSLAIFVCL